MKKLLLFSSLLVLGFISCEKTVEPPSPKLIFKIKFDSTLQRLDAFGQPTVLPAGHAAQHPQFNDLSLHNIELVPTQYTPIQSGEVVYRGDETNKGGAAAVDFDQAIIKKNNEIFYELPLSQIKAGTYQYIRTSVSYQNYDVRYNIVNIPVIGSLNNQSGTVASFVGFNTYISTIKVSQLNHTVNDDKLQGYWAFESKLSSPYDSYNQVYYGQSTGTTVVNPIHNTTPIPVGSCLVTAPFLGANLEITGNETEDIIIELSYCTNQSFEWTDSNHNGQWDVDASGTVIEPVADMGLRGLQAVVK